MSEENVEIVRRVFEAAARRDSEAVLALYDPEVEWDVSRDPLSRDPRAGLNLTPVFRGHEGLRRFFGEWYEAWENVEDDYEELIDAGEHVISPVVGRARGRASGIAVEWTHSAVWTIRDGKIVRVVWLPTREAALEAAGVRQ
jgi:ketosteroid isomerase-like protein